MGIIQAALWEDGSAQASTTFGSGGGRLGALSGSRPQLGRGGLFVSEHDRKVGNLEKDWQTEVIDRPPEKGWTVAVPSRRGQALVLRLLLGRLHGARARV